MTLETLNKLIDNGLIWLYLGELISADTNLTVQDCNNHLEKLKDLSNIINQLQDKETKDKLSKFIDDGILILNQDIERLNK
ncbi:MAG: hypothetical protein MJ224_01325 [archaeon]|nr:hypothetical protein [archaeon]